MRSLLLSVIWAGCLAVSAASVDDFEGKLAWTAWGDAKPVMTLCNDGASSAKSLEVTYPKMKQGGISRHFVRIPKGAAALEFDLKLVSGKMPTSLLLESSSAPGKPRDVFGASFAAPAPGQWVKVSIPLDRFQYSYTKFAPNRTEKDLRVDTAKPQDLIFLAWQNPGCVFRLDNIDFAVSDAPPKQKTSATIDDFEGKHRDWTCWGDVAPLKKLSNDAVRGKQSLEVTFFKTNQCGATYQGAPAPGKASGVEFWIKGVEGAMPGVICLEDSVAGGAPRDCFMANYSVPPPGRWTKVVIPFRDFRYGWTKFGPRRTEKNLRPDPTKKKDILFMSYNTPGGIFLIDDLAWSTAAAPEAETVRDEQPFGVNLLSGDCSFETGTGYWIEANAETQMDIVRNDSALGENCLEVRNWTTNYLMDNIIRDGVDYILSFYAKANTTDNLKVALLDQGWNYRAAREWKLTGEWKRYELHINVKNPERMMYFALSSQGTPNSSVLVDGIQLERGTKPTAYRPANAVELFATVGHSGEVVTVGTPVELQVRMRNTTERDVVADVTIDPGKGKEKINRNVMLKANCNESLLAPCDFAGKIGFYPVRVVVRDERGRTLAKQNASFVIAPPNDEAKSDSIFGLHHGLVPMDAKLRAGSTWIRANIRAWHAVEKEQGVFPAPKANYRNNQLITIENMSNVPVWARGKHGLTSDPEYVRGFARWVAQAYKDKVGAFEIGNEPDGTMLRHGASRMEAAKNLAGLYKVFHEELALTGKPLLINVSGEGYDFVSEVMRLAADSVDGIAAHPYAYPRYIGPLAGFCVGPEDNSVFKKMQDIEKLILQYGGKKELWIGELGWGLDYQVEPDSIWAERCAAFLSRTILLCRSFPQLKHITWFTDLGTVEGSRYDYGLWRNDNGLRPLPAVAAFASLCGILNDTEKTNIVLDTEIKAVAWTNKGENYLAFWAPVPAPDATEVNMLGAEVYNLYGTRYNGRVLPGESPYIVKLANEAQGKAIIRQLAQSKPFTVEGHAADDRTLEVVIRNNLTEAWNGVVSATDGATVKLQLAPKQKSKISLALNHAIPASGKAITIEARSGNGSGYNAQIIVPPMVDVKPLGAIDWKSVSFDAIKPQFVLNDRNQVYPPDPHVRWSGVDDLSAQIFVAWDAKGLYILAEEKDDIFEQPYKLDRIWGGDCMQVAMDCGNDALPRAGYDDNDVEYTLSFGHPMWSHQAVLGKETGNVSGRIENIITREGGATTYRMMIPWSELGPFQGIPGKIVGFNAAFPDREDGVQNYYTALSPGLTPFKNPSLYRRIRLIK